MSPGSSSCHSNVLSSIVSWNTKISNDDDCNCCSICQPPPPPPGQPPPKSQQSAIGKLSSSFLMQLHRAACCWFPWWASKVNINVSDGWEELIDFRDWKLALVMCPRFDLLTRLYVLWQHRRLPVNPPSRTGHFTPVSASNLSHKTSFSCYACLPSEQSVQFVCDVKNIAVQRKQDEVTGWLIYNM